MTEETVAYGTYEVGRGRLGQRAGNVTILE